MEESVETLRELLTLDELTNRVGMSVRNVRFYTTKGLVPPPIRRGRSGYYTPDHVARLLVIRPKPIAMTDQVPVSPKGRLEGPTAHQEAELGGRCSEASGDVEELRGAIEVLAPLQAGKPRRQGEGLALQSIQHVPAGHRDAPSRRRGGWEKRAFCALIFIHHPCAYQDHLE